MFLYTLIYFLGILFILYSIISILSMIFTSLYLIYLNQNPTRDIESLQIENDLLRLNISRLEKKLLHKKD